MKVSEIMSHGIVSVGQAEPVTAAARLLKQYNVGSLPVCDQAGKLRGIITDRDIVTRCVALEVDPRDVRISEVMTRALVTACPGDKLETATELMSRDQVRRLPVVHDGRLVGMLALSDMARREACEMEAAEALSEISTNIRKRHGTDKSQSMDEL